MGPCQRRLEQSCCCAAKLLIRRAGRITASCSPRCSVALNAPRQRRFEQAVRASCGTLACLPIRQITSLLTVRCGVSTSTISSRAQVVLLRAAEADWRVSVTAAATMTG